MLDTCEESAAVQLTQSDEAENRNHEAADQKTNAVDGVRVSNCLQAAEYGVCHTDQTGSSTYNRNCSEVAYTEKLLNAEDLLQCYRTRVQDGRQHGNNVSEQEHDREHVLGCLIVTHLIELRNRCDVALQEPRQQNECQNNQCECGGSFPSHGCHGTRESLTVCADQLLCGQVGHHQGTRDNDARQAVACNEVAFLSIQLLVTRLVRGQDSYEHCKGDKLNYS